MAPARAPRRWATLALAAAVAVLGTLAAPRIAHVELKLRDVRATYGRFGTTRLANFPRTSRRDPDSQGLALEELNRVVPSRVAAPLDEGVLLLESEQTFDEIAARWREQPPIFVRHVAPVSRAVPIDGTEEDLQNLPAALGGLFALLDPALPFSVQARLFAELPYKPFALNEALAAAVAARAGGRADASPTPSGDESAASPA